MFSTVTFLLALAPFAPQLTTLKASYTVSDPRGFEITADGALGFAIQGATLTILDGASLTFIDEVDLKEPQALSLLPYFPNGPTSAGTLFIAGGSSGLWKMDLCASLVQQHTSCGSAYNVARAAPSEPGWSRRVCIDLALLPATGSLPPALVAVFAAIGDTTKGGPSELRIYDLNPTPSHRATVALPKKHPTYSTSDDAVAYAVTGISGAQRYAYVACGTAGLVRVDVDQPSAGYASGPRFRNQVGTTWYPQRVRDVASVVASDGTGVLFAALDYGGFHEVRGNDLLANWAHGVGNHYPLTATSCGWGPAATHRVHATIVGGDKILVAFGTDPGLVARVDHGAPYNANGSWDYNIGVGFTDPGAPSGMAECPKTYFFTKSSPSATPVQQAEVSHEGGEWWSSLTTQRITGVSGGFYCYEGKFTGLARRRIDNAFTNFTLSVNVPTYSRPGAAPTDGVLSAVDPQVTMFGQEGFGAPSSAGQLKLDTSVPANWTLQPMNPAAVEWCSTLGNSCPNLAPAGALGVYLQNIFGAQSWVDPVDPTREWFFSGTQAIYHQNNGHCSSPFYCNFGDPCAGEHNVQWGRHSGDDPGGRGGWKLLSIKPSTTVTNWDTRWWQIPSVYKEGLGQGKPQDYRAGFVDPRRIDDRPPLLHAIRSATPRGYVIYKMSDIEAELQPGACAADGDGDWLQSHEGENFTGKELWTHFEFDQSCNFPNLGSCTSTIIRELAAYRCSIYSTAYENEEKWVSAITVGNVQSRPGMTGNLCCGGPSLCPVGCPQPPCCAAHNANWNSYFESPMIVLYDVTDPNLASPPPHLRRIGIVPGAVGRAWSIATKSDGTNAYAFVMDLAATLYVFDVSGPVLYGSLQNPSAPVTDPSNALNPIAVLPFPANPYDGRTDTGVDVVVEGNFLYVALGRGGVGVVDISNPSNPTFHSSSPLETPGLAEGVSIHPVNGSPALFVGETRAGMRIYQ